MAWSLVTPASRGVGFALTRHLLSSTKIPVVATARKDMDTVKSKLLDGLQDVDSKRLTVLQMDVTDESSIAAAASQVSSMFPSPAHHLRLAFCVPGILHAEKSPSQIDADHALQTFRINTIGPMLVMKHFSDFLPRKASSLEVAKDEYIDSTGLPPHAIWATMSARVGSTTDNSKGGWYSYRASKAGVTSLTKTFDLWLRNHSGDKAAAVALHPGTVRTGLSRDYWEGVEKEGKLFEPDYAAGKLLEVVRGLYLESGRGRCWDWAGKEIKP